MSGTASVPSIVSIPHHTDGHASEPVAAARLVSGTPLQRIANAYSDPSLQFHCGIWEGDVGAWRVQYTEHELCHLLKGKVRLTSTDGHVQLFAAGESFVIPSGFEGLWEVLEPAQKLYAIYESDAEK